MIMTNVKTFRKNVFFLIIFTLCIYIYIYIYMYIYIYAIDS